MDSGHFCISVWAAGYCSEMNILVKNVVKYKMFIKYIQTICEIIEEIIKTQLIIMKCYYIFHFHHNRMLLDIIFHFKMFQFIMTHFISCHFSSQLCCHFPMEHFAWWKTTCQNIRLSAHWEFLLCAIDETPQLAPQKFYVTTHNEMMTLPLSFFIITPQW